MQLHYFYLFDFWYNDCNNSIKKGVFDVVFCSVLLSKPVLRIANLCGSVEVNYLLLLLFKFFSLCAILKLNDVLVPEDAISSYFPPYSVYFMFKTINIHNHNHSIFINPCSQFFMFLSITGPPQNITTAQSDDDNSTDHTEHTMTYHMTMEGIMMVYSMNIRSNNFTIQKSKI